MAAAMAADPPLDREAVKRGVVLAGEAFFRSQRGAPT
jgi:hypothetical protein